MGGQGGIIYASDGNSINQQVQDIASHWALGSPGNTTVGVGGVAYAWQYNSWASYMRTLNAQIAGSQVWLPGDVGVGTVMAWSQMQGLIDGGNAIYNWCSHSECSGAECQTSECSNDECSNDECALGEGCASGN